MLKKSDAGMPLVAWLLLLGLILLLFAPSLIWLARAWRIHPYYSHGPLMPLLAAGFAWRARAGMREGESSDLGFLLFGGGVLAHLAALRFEAQASSALALIALLAGLLLLRNGVPALRAGAFPLILLLIAIPFPFVEHFAPPLASLVARSTASTAELLGIEVARTGAQLSVGGGAFIVGAPCSGLRSIVALTSLAVILAGVSLGRLERRIALVAAAIPLAILSNGLRMLGLIWIAERFGADQSLRFFHGPSSPVLFLLATFGLMAIGHALGLQPNARNHRI